MLEEQGDNDPVSPTVCPLGCHLCKAATDLDDPSSSCPAGSRGLLTTRNCRAFYRLPGMGCLKASAKAKLHLRTVLARYQGRTLRDRES